MNITVGERDNDAKRKRGPYRKYNSYGVFNHTIPGSTKRYWKSKRKSKRLKRSRSTTQALSLNERDTGNIAISMDVSNKQIQCHKPTNYEASTSSSSHASDRISNAREMPITRSDSEDLLESDPDQEVSTVTVTPDSPSKSGPQMTEEETPFYPDEVLTQTLLILATKLRFSLTYIATEGIMQLYGALTDVNLKKSTKYYWKKIVDDLSSDMRVHHFCPVCKSFAGEAAGDSLHCNQCDDDIDVKTNIKAHNIFIYISLTKELKEIFETTDAHEELCVGRKEKVHQNAIECIRDGKMYKAKMNDEMISINFSIDGAPVFDSSNFSIWPILCIINELQSNKIKRNVLLCGLWFGQGKPTMNEYLKPFVAESKTLAAEGFSYEIHGVTKRKRCLILMCISDSVARPLLRNSHQFNGEYGCGLCLHPGEMIAKGKGFTRVYPLDANGKPFGEGLRTHEQTIYHATVQEKGIKGPSILSEIPSFNIIESLDADWMHCVAFGVCRQFSKLWLDSANHGKDFYFGHLIDTIDSQLTAITPDSAISRTPRKISDRVRWKAHEWVVFLLFYSLPIMQTLFPQKYVKHWSLLVDGIAILLKVSIMPSEIEYANKCFIQFIHGVAMLYGNEYISFNVHLLTHLPQSVSNWGPLWTHSAFPFENANQALLQCVKSSNGVAAQICDTFQTMQLVNRLYDRYYNTLNDSQMKHLNNMLGKPERVRPALIIGNTHMLGVVEIYECLSRDQYLAFCRSDINIDEHSVIQRYKRAIVNTEMFHSKSYFRVEKRANYYALLETGEIFEIPLFLVVKINNILSCFAIGRYFEKNKNSFIEGRKLGHMIGLHKRQNNLAVVRTSLLKEKVTIIEMNDSRILLACFASEPS